MSVTLDTEWIDARIAATKAAILAYEEAITALAGGAQLYTLDTGQTRQTVQRAQLSDLRLALGALENRLATLQARRDGGTLVVRPGY